VGRVDQRVAVQRAFAGVEEGVGAEDRLERVGDGGGVGGDGHAHDLAPIVAEVAQQRRQGGFGLGPGRPLDRLDQGGGLVQRLAGGGVVRLAGQVRVD
jgi:hypothetical protein